MLSKANQGLATLEKYRARLDQVSARLTGLEFAGGCTLHDVLSVLQRAELVTRMAAEVERYIIELGTEGRLIEMQLEETVVGVIADRAALVRDYTVVDTEEAIERRSASSPGSPHQELLDFGRLAELLGYDRKTNTLDFPVSPRGYRALSRIPRLPRLVGQKVVQHFGDLEAILAASDEELAAVDGVGEARAQGDPRGASQASGGRHRRPISDEPDGRAGGRLDIRRHDIPELATRKRQRSRLELGPVECTFEVGDNVVYPHHGAGVVLKKETKELLGEERDYLTIKILHNDMTVMVPCENAHLAGLRRVIDEDEVEKVIDVLTGEVSEMPKNWNRRFKYNREKIKTGDVFELAEVVRNLAIREWEKGLSTGEKQMYTRAKKILASEFMYALDKDEDGAEEYLDGLLEERFGAKAPA